MAAFSRIRDRKMMLLLGSIIFLSVSLTGGGCGRLDKVEYSDFRDFGAEGWDPVSYLEFNPWPADSSRAAYATYDLILYVRYSDRCTLRELPLEVETVSLSGKGSERPDTLRLDLPLYSPSGQHLGKGPYTVYEVLDTLERNLRVTPGYTVTLSNLLDAPSTRGILNIGLILSRTPFPDNAKQ